MTIRLGALRALGTVVSSPSSRPVSVTSCRRRDHVSPPRAGSPLVGLGQGDTDSQERLGRPPPSLASRVSWPAAAGPGSPPRARSQRGSRLQLQPLAGKSLTHLKHARGHSFSPPPCLDRRRLCGYSSSGPYMLAVGWPSPSMLAVGWPSSSMSAVGWPSSSMSAVISFLSTFRNAPSLWGGERTLPVG